MSSMSVLKVGAGDVVSTGIRLVERQTNTAVFEARRVAETNDPSQAILCHAVCLDVATAREDASSFSDALELWHAEPFQAAPGAEAPDGLGDPAAHLPQAMLSPTRLLPLLLVL